MKDCRLLYVLLFALVLTSCQTVKPIASDTADIMETQTDVIQGGTSVEIQTRELIREIKDPVIIEKAKTLEATVIKMNADIKRANAAIVEYVKASEKNAGIMFDLAVKNEKLKGQLRNVSLILLLVIGLIAVKIFTSIRKLF